MTKYFKKLFLSFMMANAGILFTVAQPAKENLSISEFTSVTPTIYSDGGASVAAANGTVYYIAYEADQTIGKYKTPLYDNKWKVYRGADMDHLELWKTWRPKHDGKWIMEEGDEAFWPSGLWIDANGDWFTTVHIEFNYNNGIDVKQTKNWFRKIGVAKSTDMGSSWTYLENILTSDNPTDTAASFAGNYVDLGPGDQHLFVDKDYFYVTFDNNWIRKTDSSVLPAAVISGRIARCAIKDKMAPGTWTKWYNNSWSQPGLKGHDSDITFGGHHFETLFYSTYLKKYIGIGKYENVLTLSVVENLKNPQFTVHYKLDDYSANSWGFYLDPWNVESATKNFVGKTFRLYGGKANAWSIKYKTFSISSLKALAPKEFIPIYPSESVSDHNPIYQK